MRILRTGLVGAIALAFSVNAAPAKTASSSFAVPIAGSFYNSPALNLEASAVDSDLPRDDSSSASMDSRPHKGFMGRVVKRMLDDQKGMYAAPFKRSNLKWDALFLAGTGSLLATDRRIETHVPHSDFTLFQRTSNGGLIAVAGSAGLVSLYGLKSDNSHAKETALLEIETLANTFLMYAPMQLIAGRERPDEGNGKGDFLNHHALNTSFPGGHAMFTFAMATVLAHEYPKPWVRVLAYGAASTVALARFRARDHWASDTFVGAGLGFAIGSHIFHAHCDPDLSSSCHR